MRIGTSRNHAAARLAESGGQGLSVRNHLFLIGDELWRHGLPEAHRLGRHHVDQRAALNAGKHDFINVRAVFLARQNHSAARASQRLVGGGGDDIRILARVGMNTGGHQAGEVRHVDQENRIDGIGDLPEPGKIDDAGIGAAPGDDHLGLVLFGQARQLIVIDALVFAANAIRDHFVSLTRKIQMVAVGEVAAMRKIHSQDRVAWIQDTGIRGLIGLRARVRLDVGVLSLEQLPGTGASQIFDHIGVLASAAVASAGIAFGVLVREDAAGRFKHGLRGEILAGDQFQARVLPLGLFTDGIEDFGIHLGQRPRHSFLFSHIPLLPVSRFSQPGGCGARPQTESRRKYGSGRWRSRDRCTGRPEPGRSRRCGRA